jgi:hypothetical protein
MNNIVFRLIVRSIKHFTEIEYMSNPALELEKLAGIPCSIHDNDFNPNCVLPYGLNTKHVQEAMQDFLDFLRLINQNLIVRELPRLESLLMPANFSSIVGEYIGTSLAKYCPSIAKNQYHNGHPDLIPANMFSNNAVQYSVEGIEIKASRYLKGWQGHNPEDCWLLVFVFDSNRPIDNTTNIRKPFKFIKVTGARLQKEDWVFSGRSDTSRRTITASVTQSGYQKMMANWLYMAPDLRIAS